MYTYCPFTKVLLLIKVENFVFTRIEFVVFFYIIFYTKLDSVSVCIIRNSGFMGNNIKTKQWQELKIY